jgi:hypothetical protein
MKLESLLLIRLPFDAEKLPCNGIYFFCEDGENSGGHGSGCGSNSNSIKPRVVRIGIHKENNFRSKISELFLLNESKMDFTIANPKPSDRIIFRKNIGRTLMNKENDYYRKIWDIDFTTKEDLFKMNLLRNIEKEKQIESDITKTLHERFPFRFIPFQGQERRRIIGKEGLESRLIGTVANVMYINHLITGLEDIRLSLLI